MRRYKSWRRMAVLLLCAALSGSSCGDHLETEEARPLPGGGKQDGIGDGGVQGELLEDWEIALRDEAYQELEGGRTNPCSGVVPPDDGPFQYKIAVTFDDGPVLLKTTTVLQTLKSHGVQATFFVNGKQIKGTAEMDLLRQAIEEGHLLGNHTENHVDSKATPPLKFQSEVQTTHDTLSTLLAEYGQEPKFFRFPYGSANCSTVQTVKGFGYAIVGWHIDTADWCFNSSRDGYGYCSPGTFKWVPDSYRGDFPGYTLSQVSTKQGGILLMHDVHNFTVQELDNLLTALENAGYSFVRLDDATVFPELNAGFTAGPAEPGTDADPDPSQESDPLALPWIGDPCVSDAACGFAHQGEQGYCWGFADAAAQQTKGFCSLSCAGYCPDADGKAGTFCVAKSSAQTEGACVSKAGSLNSYCASIPGTQLRTENRFVGDSSAPPATASVCMLESAP